jgi:predicted RNA-binding protein YlxR (DUF448 family)
MQAKGATGRSRAVAAAGHGQAHWVRSCVVCRRRRPGDELLRWDAQSWPPRLTRLGGRDCLVQWPIAPARLATGEGTADDTQAEVREQPARPEPALRGRGSLVCPDSRCLGGWLKRLYGQRHGRVAPPEVVQTLPQASQQFVQLLGTWSRLRAEGLQRRGIDPAADRQLAVWRGVQAELAAVSAGPTGERSRTV